MIKVISVCLLIILFFKFIWYSYSSNSILKKLKYKEYIDMCKDKKFVNQEFKSNISNIFLSICLPAYNMEKYIESALLSIINQTFKFFEIIIVNDNSNDSTKNILEQIQSKDSRIKIINHFKNQGVFVSRSDALFNSGGKYILFMDPDDILMNQELFQELFSYNKLYNLDIIEFLVFHKEESKKNVKFPRDQSLSHFHNYKKDIIIQPELSDIIFFKPNSKKYSSIICRTVWNKLIKKNILLKSISYLSNDFFDNKFLIAADDTPLNVLSFHYANNYSNINIPGYLYILRKNGMSSEINENINHNIIRSYNFLLYFKFLYQYISRFNKDINFFFYDFKSFSRNLLKLKDLNANEYIDTAIEFFEVLLQRKIPEKFQKLVDDLINYFSK